MVNIWNSNGNSVWFERLQVLFWTSVSNCCLVPSIEDVPVPQNHSLWKNHRVGIGGNTVLWMLPFLLLYPLHYGESFWIFAYVTQGLWPFIERILALYSSKSIFYLCTLYRIIEWEKYICEFLLSYIFISGTTVREREFPLSLFIKDTLNL